MAAAHQRRSGEDPKPNVRNDKMNLECFYKVCVLIVVLSFGDIAAQRVLGANRDGAADRLFQSLDRNHDGHIEPSEWTTARLLRKWLGSRGVKPTESIRSERFGLLYGKFVEEIRRRGKRNSQLRLSPAVEGRKIGRAHV